MHPTACVAGCVCYREDSTGMWGYPSPKMTRDFSAVLLLGQVKAGGVCPKRGKPIPGSFKDIGSPDLVGTTVESFIPLWHRSCFGAANGFSELPQAVGPHPVLWLLLMDMMLGQPCPWTRRCHLLADLSGLKRFADPKDQPCSSWCIRVPWANSSCLPAAWSPVALSIKSDSI